MKKGVRFFAALWAAKLAAAGLRLFRRNATHLPGVIALKLCPDFLRRVDKPETVIAVTGTNGKTTVCNLLDDILTDQGEEPLNNRFGGNVRGGVVTTFLSACTLGGKIRQKVAVLEVDERSAMHIFPFVQPDMLLVTNLFRDSFKRNAHSEFIADILNANIPKTTKLIVNADDLISSHLAPGNPRTSFGIAHREGDWQAPQNIVCDMIACPHCGKRLVYDFVRYNHIGRAHCPKCGFGSLPVDYEITGIDAKQRRLTVREPGGDAVYRMLGDNITDWYNTLAAVTVLRELGIPSDAIEHSLQQHGIVRSRYEETTVGDKTVILNLAKGQNPIACSRTFDFIRRAEGRKAVILLVEDFFDAKHSTENIAWLYDTDFEFLSEADVRQVIVAGVRAADFRVRLLLAGVPDDRIVTMREEALTADAVALPDVDKIFVLFDVYTVHFAQDVQARLL
ncbi:MAG: DUF1727 domain-containing protein, partial [Clostridia bacterium]|nr:DUF1727 domain-containing protein [Clostridia bacterium]